MRSRLAPPRPDRDLEAWWPLAFLLGLGVLWLQDAMPWAGHGCLFRYLSGWPCPGCGGTRAVHALLALEPGAALALNPLATVAAVVGLGWAAYLLLARRLSTRRLRLGLSTRAVWLLLVIAILANWSYLLLTDA